MAVQALVEARKALLQIPDEPNRDRVRWDIVEVWITLRQLKEAATVAESMHKAKSRVRALSKVAVAHAKAGDRKSAYAILRHALSASRDPSILGIIATKYMEIGDLSMALQTAELMESRSRPSLKDATLQAIARTQAENGDVEGALRWVAELKSSYTRAHALLNVAWGVMNQSGLKGGVYIGG